MGVPILEVCLGDEDATVRSAAGSALRALARRGAVDLVVFLRNTSHPENRAFLRARDVILEQGAYVTPWALAKVEGRAARAVRACLMDPGGMGGDSEILHVLLRELLASDAGLFDIATSKGPTDEASRIACAALGVFGARMVVRRRSFPAPEGLVALFKQEHEGLHWAGLRLGIALGVKTSELGAVGGRLAAAHAAAAAERKAPTAERTDDPILKRLVARLPDPSKPPSLWYDGREAEGAIASLQAPLSLLRLFSDEAAKAALPKLRGLFRHVAVHELGSTGDVDVLLAGAISRIDRPATRHVSVLVHAIKQAVSDKSEGARSRSQAAVQALAAIPWRELKTAAALRRPIVDAVGLVLHEATLPDQVVLIHLLRDVGGARGAARDAVLRTVRAAVPLLRTLMRESASGGAGEKRPGSAHAAFLADLDRYVALLEVVRTGTRLLAGQGPWRGPAREQLARLGDGSDPLLSSEVAAMLRR